MRCSPPVNEQANLLAACDAVNGSGADAHAAGALGHGLRAVLSDEAAHLALEYPFKGASGPRWFRSHITRFENEDRRYAVVSHEDITHHKEVEDALDTRSQILTATGQAFHIGGWEWDALREAMFWTDATYRIHAADPTAMQPGASTHLQFSLSCYGEADRALLTQALRACLEDGESFDLELPFTDFSGRRTRIRTTGAPIRSESGEITRVIGTLMDIEAPSGNP